MENKELKDALIALHNQLISIQVRGDDVIRMANVIIGLRDIVNHILPEQEQEEEE